VDLEELGPIALTVDCDILNADGGTRCASITAASLALRLAVRRLIASGDCLPKEKRLSREEVKKGVETPELSEAERSAHEMAVMPNDVGALSVGMVAGEVRTDLDYVLDSNADVDMNVVMTSDGGFVEVQGTGEEATYTREELDAMIDAAATGISELHAFQTSILSDAS
jgi:ribonuclease PH